MSELGGMKEKTNYCLFLFLYQGDMIDLTWNHRIKTAHTDLSVLLKKLRENAANSQNILLHYNKHKYTREFHAQSAWILKIKGKIQSLSLSWLL